MTLPLTKPATTTLHVRTPPVPGSPQRRRSLGARRASDNYALVGALAGSVAFTSVLFGYLTPLSGPVGFVVTAWVAFLVFYGILVAQDEGRLAVRDRLAGAVVHSLAAIVLLVLVLVVGYTFFRGWSALPHGNFYTQDMGTASSLTPLSSGGVLHALVGTLEQIAIALTITIPLGVSCAVFLNEVPGGYARFVRTIVEAMTALPSIVAGLFIFAVYILILKQGQSGMAAGLALAVMMLPIVIRASDVVLRLVPSSLKEASYALGSSRLRTVWQVVLPTARPGLATAVILGTARGVGETSPVLLTAGYSKVFNFDMLHGPQTSLPLLAFTLVKLPSEWQIARGFGAAAVLLTLVVLLFVIARVIGGRAPGQLSGRQQRRREAASASLSLRFRTAPPTPPPAPGPTVRQADSPPSEPKEHQVRRRLTTLLQRGGALAAALLVLSASLLLGDTRPASASSGYVPISGAGSTWSSNAMDAWTGDVASNGMTVNFEASGSSAGRAAFKNHTKDFAVSEIPYGIPDQGNTDPAPADVSFAYMPIVAGGTSFMYNLSIKGKQVTNLRLSQENVAKIFTGVITNWGDPAIAADNPTLTLPKIAIVPVVRSDGSGTTAQLTTWMNTQQSGLWDAFCKRTGRNQTPCGVTSFYPNLPGSRFQYLALSTGVAGFVAQHNNAGSITYVEYSYAKLFGFPVAKLLNSSGYYVPPEAGNVAVALGAARINSDLTQELSGVYSNADKRTYPLSSYSYMIVPVDKVSAATTFNTDKGKTLGDFTYFFLCKGQKEVTKLGYSPLPKNLVQAAMAVVARIPGSQKTSNSLAGCDNPTFSADGTNLMAKNTPDPPLCDKLGADQATCANTAGSTTTTNSGTGTKGATAASSASATTGVTGQPVDLGADSGSSATGGGGSQVGADPVAIAATSGSGLQHSLMAVAVVLLGSVIVLPPMLARRASRRKGES